MTHAIANGGKGEPQRWQASGSMVYIWSWVLGNLSMKVTASDAVPGRPGPAGACRGRDGVRVGESTAISPRATNMRSPRWASESVSHCYHWQSGRSESESCRSPPLARAPGRSLALTLGDQQCVPGATVELPVFHLEAVTSWQDEVRAWLRVRHLPGSTSRAS